MNHAIFAVFAIAAFGVGGCAGGLGLFSEAEMERTGARGASVEQCVGCGTVESVDLVRFGESRQNGVALASIVGGDFERSPAKSDSEVADAVVDSASELLLRPENADVYEIFLRMDDGRHQVIQQLELRRIREGSRVLITHGNASLL